MSGRRYDALVDARGLNCPIPLVRARQALMVLEADALICVLATDPEAPRDFEEYAFTSGHELLEQEAEGGVFRIVLRKRG